MPFDPSTDFLWEATGHATSTTSVVVTHPDAGGTTAGSTVIVAIRTTGSSGLTAPAGWAIDGNAGLGGIFFYRLDNAAAAETSWTFTRTPVAGNSAWYMAEAVNLAAESFDVASAGTSGTNATGTTRSTGTAPLNASSNSLLLAVFGSTKAASGDTHSWASYTNGFTERADFNPAGVAGQCIAVAATTAATQGTFESTATFTTSTGTPSTGAVVLVYRGVDASINAPLAFHTGFEFGTHAGIGNGSFNSSLGTTATPISGTGTTYGTNYLVQSGSARNGGYGLRLVQSASTIHVDPPSVTSGTASFGLNVKAVSGSGTPMAAFLSISATPLNLLYDVTNEKFGLLWLGGSTVWQTGTTALGDWAWVDIRAKFNGSVWHADWSIETGTGDGTQTSPTDPTGKTAATAFAPGLGCVNSQTATFDYDDVVYSRHDGAYPLGPHAVRVLVPETTGATVSGTSSNFQRFTNNGTLANVSGTEGALLDDVPPTISASSDGAVQVAVAASDYLELPMTSYTLQSDEIIAGVRFLASLWGGTGTGTGTLGWRGHDGLTETTFVAASTSYDADSLTTASATYPLWNSAVWSGALNGAWTQTRLDAAKIRMGFSTDATPDMGASAVYLELATRVVPTVRQLQVGEDQFTADVVVNPYNSATVSYVITNNDPTLSCDFTYSVSGTPQSPVTVGPLDSTVVDIHADAFGDISDVTLGETP